MKLSKTLQIGAAALLLSSTAMADSVDLSSWEGTTGGNWNLQTGNNAVLQTNNGTPTIFHNDLDSQGSALSGTIKVQTTSDDDYIGFVLGYNDGDLANSAANYILIDWKQANQNAYSASGQAGLSISKVTGELGTTDAWGHTGNVTELQRGLTLGNTGWADHTEYSFDLIFTASLIEVSVDGNTELSITGSFDNGSFGFYNYSQSNVLYAGIQETAVPEVPLPAAFFMFAPALLGFMGLRRKAKAA
jgi:hypothetical protein